MDHNAHLDGSPKLHSDSHPYQYHRRYQKQTHNWDVVQLMEAKDYKYIPELLKEIFLLWECSTFTMKSCLTASQDNPINIQPTIAHIQPPDTATIVNKKQSRFQ